MRSGRWNGHYKLPEGYTPLPGFLGNPVPEGGKVLEFEKFSPYEPGKCVTCGAELPEKGKYSTDVFCSAACAQAMEETSGYLEPVISGIRRCPKCGIRIAADVPETEPCGCMRVAYSMTSWEVGKWKDWIPGSTRTR